MIASTFFSLLAAITLRSTYIDCKKHHSKLVTTHINAKWESTPAVLEVAEFIADDCPDDFWTFVDDVTSLNPSLVELPTHREQYEKSIELAEKIVSPVKMNMLRLSLSLHTYSPKIEMFGQMASERGIKCPAAVDFDGRLFCQADQLKDAIASPSKKQPDVYRVDHHYPGSENLSSVAVLYGELGSPELVPLHAALRTAAKAGVLDYVLRAFVKERPNQKVRLSGYGVELQMKSTEYKVMDDSETPQNSTSEEMEVDDPDEEIEGLNFHKLKEVHPDLIKDLDAFRAHLQEGGEENLSKNNLD